MRKVSYTQMRAELSDILDAIRNGETVVVTQRGRPDTVINGTLKLESQPQDSLQYPKYDSKTHTLIIHKFDNADEEQKKIKEAFRQALKLTFGEALSKTQTKHAKIIKALEDK